MLRITLLLLLLFGNARATEPFPALNYYTEQAPPYNFQAGKGPIDGFSVRLLELVLQELGAPPPKIQLLAWDRAYYLLTQQPDAVLFTLSRTPHRFPQFKWACPISRSRVVILGKADNSPKLEQLTDLKAQKIGAIRADVGEQLLLNQQVSEQQIVATQNMHQLLRLFVANRLPFIAVHEITAQYELSQLGQKPQTFRSALILATLDDCYAFNAAISDEVVQRFQQALRQLQQRPEFGQLQAEYQLISVPD